MTHDERADSAPREGDRAGVLIIRAWVEKGSTEPLRAMVRISRDVSAGFEQTLTLARTDEVCDTVKEWLFDLVGDTSH
jgi:hypothetical protein